MNVARPVLILAAGAVFTVVAVAALWATGAMFSEPLWKMSVFAGLLAGIAVFALADRAGISRDGPPPCSLFSNPDRSNCGETDDRSAPHPRRRQTVISGALETAREIMLFGDTRKFDE